MTLALSERNTILITELLSQILVPLLLLYNKWLQLLPWQFHF